MRRFLQLVHILEHLADRNHCDLKEFNLVGELDLTSKKQEPSYVIKIQDLTCKKELRLDGAKFHDSVEFQNIILNGGASFRKVMFQDKLNVEKSLLGFVNMDDAIFAGRTTFQKCNFNGSLADFNDTEFMESVKFIDSIFDGMTLFDDVLFNSSNEPNNNVLFSNVQFGGHLSFKDSVFACPVEFRKTVFKGNSEFLDTIFQASKSRSRYASADVQFHQINIEEKGVLVFEGSSGDRKLFESDVEFSFAEEITGFVRFVNVNFQKISKPSRDLLARLEKLGLVEIGSGCIKYRYQTEPKIIKIDKDCQNLILEIAHTFSNYFTAQNGFNLGVEIIERHADRVHLFYFTDENIAEDEFHDRLLLTEKQLWGLLGMGPLDANFVGRNGQVHALAQPAKENALINGVDGLSGLLSTFFRVSVRISLGKWTQADTHALVNSVKFNENFPVIQPMVLHQTIVNNYSQNVLAAFKAEQKQVIETPPKDEKGEKQQCGKRLAALNQR